MLMRSPILSLLLLVFRMPLNFSPNAGYKGVGFSKALLEKSFKFVPNRGDGIVTFNLGLMLLLAEVDLIPEKQSRKEDMFGARGTGRVKIVFALLTEVLIFYIRATLVQVGIFGFEWPVLGCGVCLELDMFLALNKQF